MIGTKRSSSIYSEDPISIALRPSPSETEVERGARLQKEAQAKRVSERIDEELRLDRERVKKSKGDVKLLLLGQAESGKSTLQKQFQLMYKPNSMEEERASWRTVIYFNVVHSLKLIFTSLQLWEYSQEAVDADESREEDEDDSLSINPDARRQNGFAAQPSPTASLFTPHSLDGKSPLAEPSRATSPVLPPTLEHARESSSHVFANLRRRLSPLVAADQQLADRLCGGVTAGKDGVFVRNGWQTRVNEIKGKRSKRTNNGSPESKVLAEDALVEDVARMLNACQNDIRALWEHPFVRSLITKRKLKLEEWAEFFLNSITRISAADYIPTTDDILHARIQTMGVAEHTFNLDIHGKRVKWHLYDVAGARGQRHSWVPFFDDANAIIFVAPISAFDQYLDEDPRTNRIDDSLQLFTQICSNPLLKGVHLVLFLNKTDLLQKKIDAGVKVQRYITSYGERPNEFEAVVQYFRAHFLQVHRRTNESRRILYTHLTSVVDTTATRRIITNVRDSIFRGYLQSAALV